MSTRGLIRILSEDEKTLVTIYNHYDSYPSGLGKTLIEYLRGKKLTNGLSLSGDGNEINGMEDLAALIILLLKDGPGRVYIYPEGAEDVGEEFVYVISEQEKKIMVAIWDVYDKKCLISDEVNSEAFNSIITEE